MNSDSSLRNLRTWWDQAVVGRHTSVRGRIKRSRRRARPPRPRRRQPKLLSSSLPATRHARAREESSTSKMLLRARRLYTDRHACNHHLYAAVLLVALLTGLLQHPGDSRHPNRARARRAVVLALMRQNGYLTD